MEVKAKSFQFVFFFNFIELSSVKRKKIPECEFDSKYKQNLFSRYFQIDFLSFPLVASVYFIGKSATMHKNTHSDRKAPIRPKGPNWTNAHFTILTPIEKKQ